MSITFNRYLWVSICMRSSEQHQACHHLGQYLIGLDWLCPSQFVDELVHLAFKEGNEDMGRMLVSKFKFELDLLPIKPIWSAVDSGRWRIIEIIASDPCKNECLVDSCSMPICIYIYSQHCRHL